MTLNIDEIMILIHAITALENAVWDEGCECIDECTGDMCINAKWRLHMYDIVERKLLKMAAYTGNKGDGV